MSASIAQLERVAISALQSALALDKYDARIDAHLLLQHALSVNRAWLIAHTGDTLTSDQYSNFETLLQKRLNGEPMAYILGYREFYGLNLKVTPDTLIPRPDTETLVEAALEKIAPNLPLSICDLGTGTGAIALAIAKHRPLAHVTAVDFSEGALAVAQENAQQHNIANITFLKSNWLSHLNQQRFNIIVSNPPYIEAEDAHLAQGDLRFEPRSALASGKDGLNDIRAIIAQAPAYLAHNGWLMFEHGYNQAQAVADLLSQAGFSHVQTMHDLAGHPRVTLASWPK